MKNCFAATVIAVVLSLAILVFAVPASAGTNLFGVVWDTGNTRAHTMLMDVKQDLLGFSSMSMWLAYDVTREVFVPSSDLADDSAADMKTWRFGALRQLNKQLKTWLYFAQHALLESSKGMQLGFGVEYMVNSSVGFAFDYARAGFNESPSSSDPTDNHLFRLRTQVVF